VPSCSDLATAPSASTLPGVSRRSHTTKALRISRPAAKSRYAGGWAGWDRLSDDENNGVIRSPGRASTLPDCRGGE
jgi:hypothetical protein